MGHIVLLCIELMLCVLLIINSSGIKVPVLCDLQLNIFGW